MKNNFLILSNSQYMGYETCRWMNSLDCYSLNLKTSGLNVSLEHIKEKMTKEDIVLLEDILPDICHAPKYIYCKGKGPISNLRVSIVGSRKCTEYGRKQAYMLAYKLASRGYTVVSGLALGIDASAHFGAIEGGGTTIAVMGSGILNCYPKENYTLYKKIIKTGLILSEYGLYGKPLKSHFPFRNRIISGLSDILVVIEARRKSGTMITVRHALEQGKNVYVLPGQIDSPYSTGTNDLIRQGANIIVDLDEFIDEISNFV